MSSGGPNEPAEGPVTVVPLASVIRRPTRRFSPEDAIPKLDLDAPAEFPWRVRAVKRLLDLTASGVALLLLAPVMLIVAVLVKLTSRGPVLFTQERVRRLFGDNSATFTMLKFRTMVNDAEKASGPVWAAKDDARVTRLGKVLRKSRLDELPQLINVLVGHMSLVGPRPERPFFTDKLQQEIPAYADRVAALKPGVTGWAQVSLEYDSSVDDVRDKLLYDLAYAAHLYKLSSYLKIELQILLRTVLVVITGKGAH